MEEEDGGKEDQRIRKEEGEDMEREEREGKEKKREDERIRARKTDWSKEGEGKRMKLGLEEVWGEARGKEKCCIYMQE